RLRLGRHRGRHGADDCLLARGGFSGPVAQAHARRAETVADCEALPRQRPAAPAAVSAARTRGQRATVRLSITRDTPAVSRASWTARSRSACERTVPFSVTT